MYSLNIPIPAPLAHPIDLGISARNDLLLFLSILNALFVRLINDPVRLAPQQTASDLISFPRVIHRPFRLEKELASIRIKLKLKLKKVNKVLISTYPTFLYPSDAEWFDNFLTA